MTAVIVVMIAVVVAPSPVLLLFFRRQFAKVPVRIPVRLVRPAVIIDGLVIVPHVIIGVIRIIDANIMMMFAGDSGN
jgi:hypothetical protein